MKMRLIKDALKATGGGAIQGGCRGPGVRPGG